MRMPGEIDKMCGEKKKVEAFHSMMHHTHVADGIGRVNVRPHVKVS